MEEGSEIGHPLPVPEEDDGLLITKEMFKLPITYTIIVTGSLADLMVKADRMLPAEK